MKNILLAILFLFSLESAFPQDSNNIYTYYYFSMYNLNSGEITNIKHEKNQFDFTLNANNEITRYCASHVEKFKQITTPVKKISQEGHEYKSFQILDNKGNTIDVMHYPGSLVFKYTIDQNRIMAIFSNMDGLQ